MVGQDELNSTFSSVQSNLVIFIKYGWNLPRQVLWMYTLKGLSVCICFMKLQCFCKTNVKIHSFCDIGIPSLFTQFFLFFVCLSTSHIQASRYTHALTLLHMLSEPHCDGISHESISEANKKMPRGIDLMCFTLHCYTQRGWQNRKKGSFVALTKG